MLLLHVVAASSFLLTALLSLVAQRKNFVYTALGTGSITVVSGFWLILTTRAGISAVCARALLLIFASALMIVVFRKRATINA